MAVLIEGLSVVVRNDAIQSKFAGGMSAFLAGIPNDTYCSDGELSRVGFLAPMDVKAYVERLESKGLRYAGPSGAAENVVVVDQVTGFRANCTWAGYKRVALEGDPAKVVAVCFAIPTRAEKVALPTGWVFEKSVTATFHYVETDKILKDYDFVRSEPNVDVYRDRKTGKEYYVGRSSQ